MKQATRAHTKAYFDDWQAKVKHEQPDLDEPPAEGDKAMKQELEVASQERNLDPRSRMGQIFSNEHKDPNCLEYVDLQKYIKLKGELGIKKIKRRHKSAYNGQRGSWKRWRLPPSNMNGKKSIRNSAHMNAVHE